MNPNSLDKARRRILAAACSSSHPRRQQPLEVKTLRADATKPLPLPADERFDSISLFHLLHCLPVPPESKARVFDFLAPHLVPDGELVGCTILGKGRPVNMLARAIIWISNLAGAMSNKNDEESFFVQGLSRNFGKVDVWFRGPVMLFRGREPKDHNADGAFTEQSAESQ